MVRIPRATLLLHLFAITIACSKATEVKGSDLDKETELPVAKRQAVKCDSSVPVLFNLFSKYGAPLVIASHNLTAVPFQRGQRVKILVHGFNSSPKISGFDRAVLKYLSLGRRYTVVLLDWCKAAAQPPTLQGYAEAVEHAAHVGSELGALLQFLVEERGAHVSNLHCVGHSLGAHVCRHAGAALSSQLGRITGLDPASPFFGPAWPGLQGTARFTDVIHTSAQLSGVHPMGDADFYVNGAESTQPGCSPDNYDSCSHSRAVPLFVESITSRGFVSRLCPSWVHFRSGFCLNGTSALMSEHCSARARGKYYLSTNSKSPFAQGSPESGLGTCCACCLRTLACTCWSTPCRCTCTACRCDSTYTC